MSFKKYIDELEKYKELLKNHDWNYMHSEDDDVVAKGKDTWMQILELKDLVDPSGEMLCKYKPNEKVVKPVKQPKVDTKINIDYKKQQTINKNKARETQKRIKAEMDAFTFNRYRKPTT